MPFLQLYSKEQVRSVQSELLSIRSAQTAQTAEFQTRVQHAELEAKRAVLARRELDMALDLAQRDSKAAKSKAELLQREVYQVENKSEKSKLELESEIRDISRKLTSYEKLEKELDSVVLQCADTEDELDPQRVLLGYGAGASIPTNSRRRMQQRRRFYDGPNFCTKFGPLNYFFKARHSYHFRAREFRI